MYTLPINETLTVTLYDSIKSFPANLQLDAKLYAIEQAALSLSPEQQAQRRERMDLLQYYHQQADYQIEAFNYDLSLQLIEDGYNPAELEWGCYVVAINGQKVEDYSEEALAERITALKKQGLTSEQIVLSLASINEQMSAELKRYYPSRVMSGKYNNLQRQVNYGLALADYLEFDSEENKVKLDKATLAVLTMQKPLNLRGGEVLLSLEKSQFKLYTRLQESGCSDVDNLTVYQFYGWIEVLEARAEQQTAGLAKTKKR